VLVEITTIDEGIANCGAFANAVASVGKEKEDYLYQFFMICSCSLNPVWAILR
jgi:hypothetical protein